MGGNVIGRIRCVRDLSEKWFRRQRSLQRRNFFSPQSKDMMTDDKLRSSSVDDASSTADLREKFLKAPYQRVATSGPPPLFPWRHSSELLPRLDPTTVEYAEKQFLLAGNVHSKYPTLDELATAWMFLNVPWYQMLFFNAWKEDMADNMSWAFAQGVSGILSNVYQMPFDDISHDNPSRLNFQYRKDDPKSTATEKDSDRGSNGIMKNTDSMVEGNLRALYESAHEFGKHQFQIRLDCRPTSAKIVHLFVFPFLSRDNVKRIPGLQDQYRDLLRVMSFSNTASMSLYTEMLTRIQEHGIPESTVLCQVLVACDEIFWVKDLSTGTITQGNANEEFRKVYHLVRFEKVVTAVPQSNSLVGFRLEQGNWQITDIDDHLDGNLIL